MFPHTPCSIDRTFSLWLYISLFYEVNVANEKILFTIGMYSILYSMDVGNQKKNSIFMFDYFQFNYSLILIQLIWVYIQTSNGDIFVSHQHFIPLYLVCVNFLCLFVFFFVFYNRNHVAPPELRPIFSKNKKKWCGKKLTQFKKHPHLIKKNVSFERFWIAHSF